MPGQTIPTLTWAAPMFATVGVASTVVLAANEQRQGAIIVNDSDAAIYLGIGADAVLGRGIRLNASGGAWEFGPDFLTRQTISAIAAGASKNVTVLEAEDAA